MLKHYVTIAWRNLLKYKGYSLINIIGLAIGIAYFFMNKWLQDWAYRIKFDIWMFLLPGALALILAVATVSYQAIKAALANPVESLRYE